MAELEGYVDQKVNAGQPMPWLKVVGEALIGWIRDTYPDTYHVE